jgi:hypothetical protein
VLAPSRNMRDWLARRQAVLSRMKGPQNGPGSNDAAHLLGNSR